MDEHKSEFIEFLLRTGALKVFEDPAEDRILKSKRISPWFVNIGDFNDGESSNALAGFYADAIISSGVKADVLYGIPEKAVGLAAPVAMAMASKGHNVGWCFSRKDEKKHGEASHLGAEDRIKALMVGRIPATSDAIVQLDDVFTAGDAKYEARAYLRGLGRENLPLLAIAIDRQEVATDGKEAITDYQETTRTHVVSIVNATDVLSYFKDKSLVSLRARGEVSSRALERLENYIRVYGTRDAHQALGQRDEQRIISTDRSIIPACDVETLSQFEELVRQTADVPGVGGYKIGFELGLAYGLPAVVSVARKHTDKPLIYDHQKAGTDIPDTGRNFARVMKQAGIDTVILFPQAGPETERAWIYQAFDHGLNVIVGGRMTHPAYAVSEGGFITDDGALEMYRIAAASGVHHFVVPGNKPAVISQIRELVVNEGVSPIFYSPGFVAQGGKIDAAAKVAGDRFHGIVGRGIYQAKDMREAAIAHAKNL